MPAYQKWSQGTQKLEPKQDRETDKRDRTFYHAAFAGGNDICSVARFLCHSWTCRWTNESTAASRLCDELVSDNVTDGLSDRERMQKRCWTRDHYNDFSSQRRRRLCRATSTDCRRHCETTWCTGPSLNWDDLVLISGEVELEFRAFRRNEASDWLADFEIVLTVHRNSPFAESNFLNLCYFPDPLLFGA